MTTYVTLATVNKDHNTTYQNATNTKCTYLILFLAVLPTLALEKTAWFTRIT